MGRRLAAIAALASVIAGVPAALIVLAGPPWWWGAPDVGALARALELHWIPLLWVVRGVAALAWILWGWIVLSVVLRLVALVAGRRRGTRLRAVSDRLAWAPLKVALDIALGVALAGGVVSHGESRSAQWPSGPWGAGTVRSVFTATVGAPHQEAADAARPRRTPSPAAVAGDGLYVVRTGDSLWSIAEERLGDGLRWGQLWRLNEGRTMPDGEVLDSPGFIRPGWRLALPPAPGAPGGACAGEAAEGSPKEPTPHAAPRERESPDARQRSGEEIGWPRVRIELPSGTAVAAAFVAGLASARASAALRARRRGSPLRAAPSDGDDAERVHGLRNRLVRALGRERGLDEDDLCSAEDIDGVLDFSRAREPATAVLVGHRGSMPVDVDPSDGVIVLSGDPERLRALLSDLCLHALVSTRDLTVWADAALDLPTVGRVRLFSGPTELVDALELEVITRRRIVTEEGVSPWRERVGEARDERLFLLVVVLIGDSGGIGGRLDALAGQIPELGIVVFTRDSGPDAIEVRGDGLHPRGAAAERLGGGRIAPVRVSEADRVEAVAALGDVGPTPADQRREQEPADADPQEPVEPVPARVHLLGPMEVVVRGGPVRTGLWPKTRELLAYLLLHPEGVSRERIVDALWPDADPDSGADRFWARLGELRRILRAGAGASARFIDKAGDVYRVDRALFDVDLWSFDAALDDAARQPDDPSPLLAAGELYRGDLLEGSYFEWAEELRAHVRSRFVDAMVSLSRLETGAGRHEAALRALTRALAVEPYAEELHTDAMRLHAMLGRPHAVRRQFAELERALEELDVEPGPELQALRDRLATEASRLRTAPAE